MWIQNRNRTINSDSESATYESESDSDSNLHDSDSKSDSTTHDSESGIKSGFGFVLWFRLRIRIHPRSDFSSMDANRTCTHPAHTVYGHIAPIALAIISPSRSIYQEHSISRLIVILFALIMMYQWITRVLHNFEGNVLATITSWHVRCVQFRIIYGRYIVHSFYNGPDRTHFMIIILMFYLY